jgi:hypothetical protein
MMREVVVVKLVALVALVVLVEVQISQLLLQMPTLHLTPIWITTLASYILTHIVVTLRNAMLKNAMIK